jgi:NodT family efflux transporter outer membrane factor (OMF) lipoprotein
LAVISACDDGALSAETPNTMAQMQTGTARRAVRCAAALAFAPWLAGCILTTDTLPTGAVVDVPPKYREASGKPRAALPAPDWWRGFRSRELTMFVERAHLDNLDIAAAVARIEQADANTRIAGAPLLPAVDFDGSVTRSGTGATPGTTTYRTALNASYEIDLWGKNRAALRSAEFSAIATRFDREVIVLSTVASVINTYFQILAAQDRLRIARDNVNAANRILKVFQDRLGVGTATGLDIAQQESLVAQQRAAIPPLDQQLKQSIATLALLLGEPPSRLTVRGGSLSGIMALRPSPGLPSDLLLQRPDIRQVEAQLAAANADVQSARGALFPSIALTGQGGFVSTALNTLFIPQAAIYSVAAGLTQPVFDGFRLLSTLDLRKSQRTELLQIYRKAILSGFTDVEQALIAVRDLAEQERLQTEVVATSRRAYELSESQLRVGTIDITTVLNTQRTLFQAQDQLVLVRLTRLQAIVSLFQALGGGWVLPDEIASDRARGRRAARQN